MTATPIPSTPRPPPQIFTPENPTAQAANTFSDLTTIARVDSISSNDTIMGMDDNPRGINDVPPSRAPARTEDPEAQAQTQTRAKIPARTRNETVIRDLLLLIYAVLSVVIQVLLGVFVLHRLVIITIVLQIEVTLVILILGDETRGAVRRGWERAKGYVGMGAS
ncbi:hypothetical protein B0O99DRAFT_622390 [Bisporella sp. PMI_857]|nr:hypothetical protein B0O99DRAFT_622390 [Bisporella sp. PMI_857]